MYAAFFLTVLPCTASLDRDREQVLNVIAMRMETTALSATPGNTSWMLETSLPLCIRSVAIILADVFSEFGAGR